MAPPRSDAPNPDHARTAGQFQTTRWSLILAAAGPDTPGARDALGELCSAYWYPVYAFIRRRGHGSDEAADVTQEFFARLLERGDLRSVDPSRGRFRSFLLASCTHFLCNERDRAGARKRGGDRQILSIDAGEAEGRFRREPSHVLTAERLYERRWALTLLPRVFERLRGRYRHEGKAELYERLKGTLTGERPAGSHAGIARELGMSEGALQVAAHRLRRRYREALREEIAATVADPAEVDEEVRALFVAVAL